MMDLFDSDDQSHRPLAERMRPVKLDDIVGQTHILGAGKPLRLAIEQGHLHSLILWGPPGVGKTTLARVLADIAGCHFAAISAVMSGVKEIREVVGLAKQRLQQGTRTILFVDEVHRFNKSQQDAFLPFVENGTVIFVGATTENPSFELNNALLSRARVYRLQPLAEAEMQQVLDAAAKADNQVAGLLSVLSEDAVQFLLNSGDGDARRLLGMVEVLADCCADGQIMGVGRVAELLGQSVRRFDKGGDVFYEQISAMHKSVRGSSPDGALYWLCRMLDGGCDPLYIARRLVRMASEDIGNADPRALSIALDAWQAQERLGSPEGELSLAQAVVYLASAPKSNAVYQAFNACMALIREDQDREVPMHLRNAPTELMKDIGMGQGYRYAHDEPEAYAAGESYLPEALADKVFYQPADRGLEIRIKEKLARFRQLDNQSTLRRYP